ncbi:hypothetical protein B0J12DRAFT_113015 [Macrophomina phaseolina]|uniref:Uncharacterized protein n=1 Tax=Macrophomina phaseolina TaxID=35725 RepID=A0ABQ8G8P2_9PEZI|nr:hypothetical protein B0J12DRAFT_113015 [Macrophomina phaseolina]
MADGQTALPQKRPRGRPRKQPVLAATEAPVAITLESALPAKKIKATSTKNKESKKAAVTRKSESEAQAAVDAKATKATAKTTVKAAATTKSKRAPAVLAAGDRPAPPQSPPPTSAIIATAQPRKLREPLEKARAAPQTTTPSSAPPITHPAPSARPDSKILSALAAQNALPLQQSTTATPIEALPPARKKDQTCGPSTANAQIIEPPDHHQKAARSTHLSIPQRETSPSSSTPTSTFAVTPESAVPLIEQQFAPVSPSSSSSSAATTVVAPTTAPTATAPPPSNIMPAPHKPTTSSSSAPARRAPAAAAPPPAQSYRAPSQQKHQQQQGGQSTPRPPPRSEWKPAEPLPAKYKPAARRVTLAMVAAPIAIVTSWVLYERLVLGRERKEISRLMPPLARAVEDVKKSDP